MSMRDGESLAHGNQEDRRNVNASRPSVNTNTVSAPKEYKLSKFSTYYIFILLFLLYFFDYVDRMIVTSLFPYIQKEWGLTDTQSGLLVSVVYWSIVVFVFAAFSFLDGKTQYMMLLLMGVLASMFAPASITVTQEVIHPGLRAISYSVCVVIQNLFGASMAPIVIGALSDAYGIKVAMSILPVFLLISALLFFVGSFSYKKDLDKVEKIALECED